MAKVPHDPQREERSFRLDLFGFGSATDDWFAVMTNPSGERFNHVAFPHQAIALQRYLNGQATSQETAAAMAHWPPDGPEPDYDLEVWAFLLMQLALLELPQAHIPALTALIKDLESIMGRYGDGGLPLYRNCGSFNRGWEESYHVGDSWRYALGTRDPDLRNLMREHHIRIAFVEATCAMMKGKCDEKIGHKTSHLNGILPISYGYKCLSDALERRHGVVWDFEIPAAAVWIRVAGKRILEGAKKNEVCNALEMKDRLWSPGPMSLERWDFWMDRMKDIELMGSAILNGVVDFRKESEALRLQEPAWEEMGQRGHDA